MLAALLSAAALAQPPAFVARTSLRQASAIVSGAGGSIAAVGDVNGDGRADLAVSRPGSEAVILFGPLAPGRASLGSRLAHGGVAVTGIGHAEVRAAGDVNGDGLADVLVDVVPPDSLWPSLPAYVIFGRRTSAIVDVGALDGAGFRIDAPPGTAPGIHSGFAAGRDVNGDGRADLTVSLFDTSWPSTRRDSVYVVFGRSGSAPVQLDELGDGGYRIDGDTGQGFGLLLALIGDANGDGRAELAIGGFLGSGVRVAYGRDAPGAVEADEAPGFSLSHGTHQDFENVADAGDVDGDGRGDLLVSTGSDYYGTASVVLTTGRDVDLALTAGVYSVGSECGLTALANAGDVNGDGRPDALVGCPIEDAGKNLSRGGGYLLYGRADPASPPALAAIALDSPAAYCACAKRDGYAGSAVAAGGDLDGDGAPDLALVSSRYEGGGGVYVMTVPHVVIGTDGPDTLRGTSRTDLLIGRGGNDTILGLGGNDALDGGDGKNRIDAGSGNDLVYGGAGSDTVVGGPGNDDLFGSGGNDVLDAGPGDDHLGAGAGADRIDGGLGNDIAFGEAGNDRVAGGTGADTLFGDGFFDFAWIRPNAGGTGRDTILGGPGRDDLWGGGGADAIDGGTGIDTGDGPARRRDGDRVRSVERHRR